MSFASDGLVLYPISTRMAGRRAVVRTMKPACLTPRSSPVCTDLRPFCTSSATRADSRRCSLSCEVLQDEVEPAGHGLVLLSPVSNRTASFSILATRAGVFGAGLGQEEGLESANFGVPAPPRQRVDVQAHKEIAGSGGAVAAPIAERDERVGGPVIRTPTPRRLQLVAQQDADLQGDVLLPYRPAGKVESPDSPGSTPPCPGSMVTMCWRRRVPPGRRSAPDARLRRRSLDRRGLARALHQLPAGIHQPAGLDIVAVALREEPREHLGHELQREVGGVALAPSAPETSGCVLPSKMT